MENCTPMKRKNFLFTLLIAGGIATFFMFHSKIESKKLTLVFQSLPETKEPKMAPNDWLAKQKLYPNAEFSYEHYLYALQQAVALHKSSAIRNAAWELAGPTNIGGRITDIAINPANPTTMYIGAASGGIFKTTDSGNSWEHLFTDAPVISIGALVLDPANENILYAGTGEANSSSFSFIGNGLYKSVDAGQSWNHIGLEQSAYIGRILVDHSNSERVFVAALGTLFTPNEMRGIYRSINGGNDWERVLFVSDSTAGVDIVQHPTNPDILYATMWERMRGLTYRRSHGATSGIYKSIDGGDSWTLLTNGLPGGNEKGRIGLAIAKNNPEIVYAFIDRLVNGNYVATVYKTTNGGQNWQQTNDGSLSGMNSNFGWYFGQIRVDPQNDNRIWVLGVDLYRSENGGNSYTQIAGYFNLDQIYVDHHAMFIHPLTGEIIHGNDGGLYKSSNYGNSWSKINNLPLTQFYAIEVDYLNPQRIYGGTQDNNTIRTWTGALNDWERILGGDGFYTLVDYTNSNTIYAESQWGNLARSTNGGNSFSGISAWSGDRTNWSSPYVMHPTDPQTLFFGTYRIWKTTNRGNSWTPISGDLTHNIAQSGFSTITTIAISPLNPNLLLTGSDDGRVHLISANGMITNDISAGLPVRWITRVAFDPFDVNTIYATVSGFRWDEPHPYVFRSTNLGQSWEPISTNLPALPVNVIVADPSQQGWLYIGTDAGIFYTENGGASWGSLMQGLPNVPVTDLKIHQPTRTLIAGTYGCSAYRLNLDLITGNGAISEVPVFSTLKAPYPNPVSSNQQLTVEYYLAKDMQCTLDIFDVKGSKVKTLFSGFQKGGAQQLNWNLTDNQGRKLPKGFYILRLNTITEVKEQKVILN
jgi:photosystem II stability/assembly factor-like uncharacterized protein